VIVKNNPNQAKEFKKKLQGNKNKRLDREIATNKKTEIKPRSNNWR
jgi:hypothetical protein